MKTLQECWHLPELGSCPAPNWTQVCLKGSRLVSVPWEEPDQPSHSHCRRQGAGPHPTPAEAPSCLLSAQPRLWHDCSARDV